MLQIVRRSFLTGVLMTCLAAPAIAEVNIDYSSSFLYPGYSKRISMDFQEAPLVDILKIFSQQTSLNLISSEELASKRVTAYLDNVPIEQALEQVLRANNLTYELQPDSNIYIVKPVSKLDAELLTRVYALRHASVSNARIAKTLKISYKVGDTAQTVSEEGGGGGGGGGGGFGGGGGGGGSSSSGILSAIKGVLTPKGNASEDTRTNSLIITDIASNFGNIEAALGKLDVAVPQVLIEVEMLEVSKETVDLMGVKYGDSPLSFTGAVRQIIYPWDQNALLGKGYVFEDAEYTAGTLSAAGMTALLQFLQTQSDTKNLARPRILTLSNQPAQIKIATNEAVSVTTQTTASDTLSQQSVEAEREETGVFLTVTPQVDMINNDVTMAVVPTVITTRISTLTAGGATVKDPEERGSLSILRVASGDTVVIGGLIREDRALITTKIPFLGDLPFIGSAFRHKDDTVQNRELIIFITPHILDDGLQAKTSRKGNALLREQAIPTASRMDVLEKELSSNTNKK